MAKPCLVPLLLLLPACALASTILDDVPDAKVAAEWNFETDAEGWAADNNMTDPQASEGYLWTMATGPDPSIMITGLSIEAGAASFIGIRMRTSRHGYNQIYFATDSSPQLGEDKMLSREVHDGDERFYEIKAGATDTWRGRITAIRLDPANRAGDEEGTEIAIDYIAVYQKPARLRFDPPAASVPWAKRGDEVEIVQYVTNTGGETLAEDVPLRLSAPPGVEITGPATVSVPHLPPEAGAFVRWRARVRKAGHHVLTVANDYRGAPYSAEVTLVAPIEGGDAKIEAGDLTLDVDERICGAAVRSRSGRLIAVWQPLAQLIINTPEGGRAALDIAGERAAQGDIVGRRELPGGGVATLTVSIEPMPETSAVRVRHELVCDRDISLRRFQGVKLLAGAASYGAAKRHALFPGLEYLGPNDHSSAEGAVGPKFADRRAPAPHKITVPMMCVEYPAAPRGPGGLRGLLGLAWDPLQEWAEGRTMPAAEFASPNFVENAASHLMALFAPSVGSLVEENRYECEDGFDLRAGDPLRLSCVIFADEGADITRAVPNCYSILGEPEPPPPPRTDEQTIETCMRAYRDALWFPEEGGWQTHKGLAHESPKFNDRFAAELAAHARRTGDTSWLTAVGLPESARPSDYLDTSMQWVEQKRRERVAETIARQAPDGGWPYEITDEMREKTKGFGKMVGWPDVDTLGEVGSTNVGVTARTALSVLGHALVTADPASTEAGLAALSRLGDFTVPAGAQTWEVHMDVPDVYGAAVAVDAYVAGYKLTGDPEYLEKARWWAYTGLPFFYSWPYPRELEPIGVFTMGPDGDTFGVGLERYAAAEFYDPPQRHFMPLSTIPVFGTSFYVVSWFGVAVQWCGQGWANATQRLLEYVDDPLLGRIADGVYTVTTWWQFERGFLAGMYPDVWNVEGNSVHTAFIEPGRFLTYALGRAGSRDPTEIETVVAAAEDGTRVHVSSRADLDECRLRAGRLSARLAYVPGDVTYTLLTPTLRPEKVIFAGQPVSEGLTDEREAGWLYDPAGRHLHIKLTHPDGAPQRLDVIWPQ